MSSLATKAVETATEVAKTAYEKVDPYVPNVAKSAVTYAAQTAYSAGNFAYNTANATIDTTQKTVGAAYDFTTSTATAVKDRAVATATGAVTYAKDTAVWAANGTTSTITAFTPGPVKDLVTNTLAGASALRQDPVGTVKPYVPTFIIHTGEKTYEVVIDTTTKTKENITATTGFIVTKVNGTVEYITHIPQVAMLIEKLNSLTAPVLNRVRGTTQAIPAAEAEAEIEATAAKKSEE